MENIECLKLALGKAGLENHFEKIMKRLTDVFGQDGAEAMWSSLSLNIRDEHQFSLRIECCDGKKHTLIVDLEEKDGSSVIFFGNFVMVDPELYCRMLQEEKNAKGNPMKLINTAVQVGEMELEYFFQTDPGEMKVYYGLKNKLFAEWLFSNEKIRLATDKEKKRAEFTGMFSKTP